MIYLKCPSCGYIIGNRQIPYENGLNKIESDPNNTEDMKLLLKENLLKELKIERYCCKMRIITFKQKTEIFK